MEYAVVFGLAIPLMLPMLAIVLAVQCAAFQFARQHLLLRITHDHRPPLQYLWFSAFLGFLLLACFFVDNNMQGAWLAIGGPPTMMLYWFLYAVLKRKAEDAPTLRQACHQPRDGCSDS